MTSRCKMSGLDFSGEGTGLGWWMVDLTAANFNAQTALFEAIKAGIRGVSLIAFDGAEYAANFTERETDLPADAYAERESKWLVTMVDSVNGDINQFEIGGALKTGISIPGSDLMDLTSTEGAALVDALEAGARSRAGNAVTVRQVKYVGRST